MAAPKALRTQDLCVGFAVPQGFREPVDDTTGRTFMTTSISPVSQPHVNSQPKPATQHPQASKPPAQSATQAQDKLTLRSTQKTNQEGSPG